MADISNKERFRQRYAKRNPDLNMDDEEAYYGSVNQFMDEYEGYEGNSKKMRENLSKSPAFAELMVAARDQDDFDPVVWMVQNKGLDLKAWPMILIIRKSWPTLITLTWRNWRNRTRSRNKCRRICRLAWKG